MVMQGLGTGFAGFVKCQNPSAYILGCPCYLISLAASKAADKIPLPVEDILIKIFYYLDKSSKRHQNLKDIQVLCGKETHKILKHVATRWLSLGTCLARFVEQWDALKIFFKQELKSKSRKKLKKDDKSETLKRYLPMKEKCPGKSEKKKEQSNEKKKDQCHEKKKEKSIEKKKEHFNGHKKDEVSGNTEALQDKAAAAFTSTVPGTFDVTNFIFKQTETMVQRKKEKDAKAKKQAEEKEARKQADQSISKAEEILRFLRDKNSMLYCTFLLSAIPLFDVANQILQKEEPCVHILHSTLSQQLQKILVRFVKNSAFEGENGPLLITEVDFRDLANQKPVSELAIGFKTKEYIAANEGLDLKGFYSSVHSYYSAACDYMIKKFPFNDMVLLNAEVADISKRKSKTFDSVVFFTSWYPCLLPPNADMDALENQFLQYQIEDLSDMLP